MTPHIVHREHETIELRACAGDRIREIGREGRDAAPTREMIPEHRDPAN
jgi:hypothetical protein